MLLSLSACSLPGRGSDEYLCSVIYEHPNPLYGLEECKRRLCGDSEGDAYATIDALCPDGPIVTCTRTYGDGCTSTGVATEDLMGAHDPANILGTINTDSSWVYAEWEGTGMTVGVRPTSTISINDGGDPGESSRLAVTNMETYGYDTVLAGHTADSPQVVSNSPFRGWKDADGDFLVGMHDAARVDMLARADLDGQRAVLQARGYAAEGNIDYASGKIVIEGYLQGYVDGEPVPFFAEYHLEYDFEPRLLQVYHYFEGDIITVEVEEIAEEHRDLVWYAGDPMLEMGSLPEARRIGTGATIDVANVEADEVTLLIFDRETLQRWTRIICIRNCP